MSEVRGDGMKKDDVYGAYITRKCPVCGKSFIPAPYHVYKVLMHRSNKLVCSWACKVAYDKEREEYRRRSIERANEKRRLKRESKRI